MIFKNIPRLLSGRKGWSETSISLGGLINFLDVMQDDCGFNLTPDFQRSDTAWNLERKEKFIEFLLKGGKCPPIYFNSPGYAGERFEECDLDDGILLIDGLQRLTAILGFLKGEVKAFGCYISEFEDKEFLLKTVYIRYVMLDLQTKKDILTFYLELNEGHVEHTEEELNKVRNMLEDLKFDYHIYHHSC